MSRSHEALTIFQQGFNCAQATLCPFAQEYGLSHELALKVAGAFGGGIGRTGELCGAISGACIAIGLKYGKTSPEENDKRDEGYRLARELMDRFQARHGSILCRDLIGCVLSTPEGQKIAQEKNVHHDLCPKFVRDAVLILEELLQGKNT